MGNKMPMFLYFDTSLLRGVTKIGELCQWKFGSARDGYHANLHGPGT